VTFPWSASTAMCACQIYEGTSDVQKILIQRALA
jgi:alkylation response protein AidB-like acyl-CoA dehydrogenase